MNLTPDHGYGAPPGWREFKPKLRTPQKPVIYLEWDELMRERGFHDPKRPWLDGPRDFFVFCSFTGLRWSDVGEDALRVTTRKTADALTIELNRWSREVLDRRSAARTGDLVFPRMTNQVTNRALKEICRSCGIDAPVATLAYRGGERLDEVRPKWEVIGTHAARRTFVVNALRLGVPPTVVMQWTGHSGYDAMRPYIAVADRTRAQAMTRFDGLGEDENCNG